MRLADTQLLAQYAPSASGPYWAVSDFGDTSLSSDVDATAFRLLRGTPCNFSANDGTWDRLVVTGGPLGGKAIRHSSYMLYAELDADGTCPESGVGGLNYDMAWRFATAGGTASSPAVYIRNPFNNGGALIADSTGSIGITRPGTGRQTADTWAVEYVQCTLPSSSATPTINPFAAG